MLHTRFLMDGIHQSMRENERNYFEKQLSCYRNCNQQSHLNIIGFNYKCLHTVINTVCNRTGFFGVSKTCTQVVACSFSDLREAVQ